MTNNPFLKKVLILFLLMLGVLTVSRFVNYYIHLEYFADKATPWGVLGTGLIFDLQTCGYLLLLPSLLLLVPLSARLEPLKKVVFHLGFFIILCSIIGLFGDSFYFGIVSRHAFRDIILLSTELHFVLPLILSEYLLPSVACLILLSLVGYGWVKYWKKHHVKPIKSLSLKLQSVQFIIAFFVLFVIVRGFTFEGKSRSLIDAYQGHNEQEANLVLNGIYTSFKGLAKSKNSRQYRFFDDLASKAPVSMNAESTGYADFSKSFPGNTPNKRNLFIILVEALSYEYIDALAGTNYGATPFLDELSTKAEVYDNFYSVGQRSYYGVQGLLFGIAPLEGIGFIGGGLELSRLTKLGKIAKKNGYYTQMLQSSNRDSIRLNSIADYSGFETYLGRSDIPVTRTDYPDADAAEFGWDYEMLMKTFELANQQDKPFLSFSFTGTTHMPYVEPPKQWQVYPHGEDRIQDFLNTVHYTDQSLKAFFALAKQQPWFNNTTFMIMADHTLLNASASLKKSFHIPLWIYQPGQNIKPQRHQMMASHLDILPTVFDLLGFDDEFSAMGQSLYREKEDYSIVVKGNLFGAFTQEGNFLSSGKSIVHSEGPVDFKLNKALKIEESLKYKFQKAQKIIVDNVWVKE